VPTRLDAATKYPLATACAGCSSSHRYSESPATVALMFRAFPQPLNAPAGHGLGLGLAVLTNPESYGVAGTSGLARSSGALGTTFWIDPDKQIVAILMTQYSGEPSDRLTRAFQALVYQAVTD